MPQQDNVTIIESNSPEETLALGRRLGAVAKPGEVYTLLGDLGVGKTVLTQGIADGLGIMEPVSSPTFTIVQVYEEGRMPFYHFDVYRIGDIEGRSDHDRVGEPDRGDPSQRTQRDYHRKRSGKRIRLSPDHD